MKKLKLKLFSMLASVAMVISCLFAPTMSVAAAGNGPACGPLYRPNTNYQIINWATWHNLNMWVTDANYLYNGTPVTGYGCYLNDNTQWFRFQAVGATSETGSYPHTTVRTEYVITSTNTTYALNIGYRVAGSNAVMYNRYWDTETWIVESGGMSNGFSRIILKSNPSLCLAENPTTHEIYLEPISYNSPSCYNQTWFIGNANQYYSYVNPASL